MAHESAPEAPLLHLPDLMGGVLLDSKRRYAARANAEPLGPVTGLPRLDELLGGYLVPGVHVLHGDPGAGKTALALQVAASCGCPALYVSAEMGPMELGRRLIANLTSTPLQALKDGRMSPDEVWALAAKASSQAARFSLLDATSCPAPPARVLEAAREVKGSEPHLLLVLDSLHSWAQGGIGKGTEYEVLGEAWGAARRLGAELEAAVLVIAERNRSSRESSKARKDRAMEAAAGHRAAEYGAETVLSLHADEEDAPPESFSDPVTHVTASVVKNRHGMAGKGAPLTFHGSLQRFTER